LPDVAFYIFFSTIISTEYFKNAALSLFFSSKCRLFHNATFFGSCILPKLYSVSATCTRLTVWSKQWINMLLQGAKLKHKKLTITSKQAGTGLSKTQP
jgi:hypothetical protein